MRKLASNQFMIFVRSFLRPLLSISLLAAGCVTWAADPLSFTLKIESLDRQFNPGLISTNFFNGKAYSITPTATSWQTAEDLARSLGGHLVVINSAAENTFIQQTYSGFGTVWIGLTDQEVETTFKWVDGAEVKFTNWNSGEPNDSGGEDFGTMLTSGFWNDNKGTASFRGVMEFDTTIPRFTIENLSPTASITDFVISIRDTSQDVKFLSAATYADGTSAGIIPTFVVPAFSAQQWEPNKDLEISFTGFGPGKKYLFLPGTGFDYRTVLFNAANSMNARVTVKGSGGQEATMLLPDGPARNTSYTFQGGVPKRQLTIKSVAEADSDEFVSRATVKVLNQNREITGIGKVQAIPDVFDGDTIEITVPQEVFLDLGGTDITSSVSSDPVKINDQAEERYSALGISVNNVPQTGDPTVYRFEIKNDTDVIVKWRHDYALTIQHDRFIYTQSIETDETGNPWAGPLTSLASGNPEPEVKKHWIKKGESVIATIDGQVLDLFARPGLDIRYVPTGYRAYGPPNPASNDPAYRELRFQGVDIREDPKGLVDIPFQVGQNPAERQQVKQFVMDGPAGITYQWQIQYGVRVNTDNPARAALPKIFSGDPSNPASLQEVASLEGVFWFNPGASLVVATTANETDQNSPGLIGWINGDGYYFSSSGEIDTSNGTLTKGGPAKRRDGSPAAQWVESLSAGGKTYRGLFIPNLQRAGRVLWEYGQQTFVVEVTLGEFVFQNDPTMASIFTTQPDMITKVNISGLNQDVGDSEMAVWDKQASRLYPVVPGKFKAKWKPDAASSDTVEVTVIAKYPTQAHYRHITDTPPVALDPDPTDNFVFQGLKYSENKAVVDGQKKFTASAPGKSVLLFTEIQRVGRGEPRDFMRVRVVDSKNWDDGLGAEGSAIIGQKIGDGLDLAKLGTGYVKYTGARYNGLIYDVTRLDGLAAKDVYDMTLLRADKIQKVIAHKENLPGPVIPVNLYPNTPPEGRIVIVWYDDPALTDEILWPYKARVYKPRWPASAAEGLGRIVIASQYGSESVDENGKDQEVAPAINDLAAEVSYNPTRLQQVQIYSQPDRALTGYNPNEEHALLAPSLRYADVSPRPSAVYALRNNDLNSYFSGSPNENGQDNNYTSHPFVLVQFFDTADEEFKMRVYRVLKEDNNIAGYRFPNQGVVTPNASTGEAAATPLTLRQEPHLTMEASEPVIPFYPLVHVIGASPCGDSFGVNLKKQTTYWEDHKGSSWSVSGGSNAWFTVQTYYPLAPDFYWPPGKAGFIRDVGDNTLEAMAAFTGDCVSFLPGNVSSLLSLTDGTVVTESSVAFVNNRPVKVLYKSEWPANPPVLKAGETLTFQGGEYHADVPTATIEGKVVETQGLPAVVAFASAEVIFDSLNPLAEPAKWNDANSWTARIAQVLDVRSVPMSLAEFPADLQPATKKSRVKQGKYIFNDLPASLQKRFRFDPLAGKLEMIGVLNDKEIGDRTLTAAPPAVYILEPNVITTEEETELRKLTTDGNWQTAITELVKLSRNPSLIDTDHSGLSAPGSSDYRAKLEAFWNAYYLKIGALSAGALVPLPVSIADADGGFLVGLEPKVLRDGNDAVVTIPDPAIEGLQRIVSDPRIPVPARAFGPGLALIPNGNFLDPSAGFPDVSWVSVVENNDPSLGGSPITIHVIKVDRTQRYRGAIKTVLSENVFDENLVLRHQGDFGAHADDLFFEWWYRPDDGSLNVPPPDLLKPGQPNPWKLFPDPTGERGRGRFQVTLRGSPNAPEALLADTFWFVRYRHANDAVQGSNWKVPQADGSPNVNFIWAGAGNSDPFHDLDGDGINDYKAQLAMGWIKRVLDAVNPYEARIRDFEGDNPSTKSSMIAEFGPRFEGPVALNPDKNVIENVGLIELYETILKRGKDFSIDLSQPLSTPALANALELASTRISDFYVILGNEAYSDAADPTIGFGSDSVEYGSLAPSVFAFQNQMSSLIEEELGLLRGVDDSFARPVYNRLFWNFTKGEGEAAYAMNYNITDVNKDGFINEDDAMILYPQGHGDAWGHYLTALRNQYDLLRHPYFNWVSRSEFYNLQDIVIKVDFLDERKFARAAAAKAKAGAEIVNLTYRSKYVEDPTAQWQGYTDSSKLRAWGAQEWARRAGQGAYFDWITANALLPSEHPNTDLEGIQKVDRKSNSDISVISANLNAIQNTFDQANRGQNPLGLSPDGLVFDIDPTFLQVGSTAQIGTRAVQGLLHFDQIYERALRMVDQATAIWDGANDHRNRVRTIANNEAELSNSVFQEDLSYRNQLIALFGKPYEGTIGPGKVYPAGYTGPDTLLFMYVDVRTIDNTTVPGPTEDFAKFTDKDGHEVLSGGDIYDAFVNGKGNRGDGAASIQNPLMGTYLTDSIRGVFAPTFASDSKNYKDLAAIQLRDKLYNVNYTDVDNLKVSLDKLDQLMPITASGYTFQAPRDWGSRLAVGELQQKINEMLQQEAEIAIAIGAWDSLQGDIVRTLRLINAKLDVSAAKRINREVFSRIKLGINDTIKAVETIYEVTEGLKETIVKATVDIPKTAVPNNLPTGGLSVSPGDALGAVKAGMEITGIATESALTGVQAAAKIGKLVAEISLDIAENELQLFEQREEDALAAKELLVELENKVGDEPIKRIAVFKEIEALRGLSAEYRAKVDEASRLIDERAAYNKRVAAQTQLNRYQDMTFRVARNYALQTYRSAFDVAARYVYLAAKAYDYETNLDPTDPGSPQVFFNSVVRARTLGELSSTLKALDSNYNVRKGQLGLNNPQIESGKISLRSENYRILPAGAPGADALWQQTLQNALVPDLWMLPEYRYYCRPLSAESDAAGKHVPEPGLVLRFSTKIMAGQNLFGRPLSGADHAFDPTHFATKIVSVGVWLSDIPIDPDLNNWFNQISATPRVYLIPIGNDTMSVPTSPDPNKVRVWKVVDQRIPDPIPSINSSLDNGNFIPLLDSLNGRLGDPRKFPMFRAYHDGPGGVDFEELVSDTRLIGRSVWNTGWLLIIPGRTLNSDPNVGLNQLVQQVSDIKLIFETYGYSGN
jgi:hypothetical protein